MATDNNLTDFLKGVADAIREKTNESGLINPQDFPERIAAIETGCGGGGQPEGTHAVRFIDVDGAELKTEYVADGGSATPPDNPERDYCTFVKWSGDYTDVTGDTVVRPQYRSSDGRSHYEIDVSPGERLALSIYHNNSEELTIDWGDGTSDTVEKSGSWRSLTHEYTASVKGWVHISDAADDQISLTEVGAKGFIKGYIDSGKSSTLRARCRGCINLGYMVIPEGVRTIADNAAVLCGNIASVVIPDGVTSIGSSAFQNCYSLASVVIPDGVTSIGSYAFQNCYSLASVVIPDGVTSIGSYAFQNCYSLASVVIPDGVTSIGSYAFQNCYSLASVVIPDGVTSIGSYAFQNCYSLASVVIPDGVTSIGSYAFQNCYSLASVVIPDGVTSIGSYAFQNCYSLASVVIPDGVTSIGSYAFQNCYSLASVVIPDGVTSIGSYAFQNCVNALFNDLPASLTGLDSMAFFNCARLTGAVSLPGVTGWLSDTFGQTGILSFSAAATTMTRTSGPGALGDCQALVRVELPNVVTFGDWTCRNDAALKLVILGESVTGIGSASLMNCASLERLVVKAATPPTLVSDALQGCSALQHIYVPDDSVETYKAATNWVAFADIILPLSEFTE